MIGPLFFSIVQAGIERGFYAGLALAFGIWVSDLLYVIVLKSSLYTLQSFTQWPHYTLFVGLAGSLLLVGFGIGSLLKHQETDTSLRHFTARSLPDYALRGFIINTVNPFTVFFWLGTAATLAGYTQERTWAFFTGMFGVLIISDVFKARAAHWLRDHLSPRIVSRVHRCIGIALISAGIVLAARSF